MSLLTHLSQNWRKHRAWWWPLSPNIKKILNEQDIARMWKAISLWIGRASIVIHAAGWLRVEEVFLEVCQSVNLMFLTSFEINSETVFKRVGGQSAVYHQPESQEERFTALQALLACPTASIRTESPPKEIKSVHASFPIPVDPQNLEGVYHCGYHAEHSYGATSYFIVRPGGNILVDSPRYTENLAKRLEAMGGVRYMFLTHKDDIADHQHWQARFNCDRILHELEVQAGTEGVEMKLQGEGPWSLGPDTELIFTPGHTEGHVVLFFKSGGGALFSGDHLEGIKSDAEKPSLSFSKVYNHYSVNIQLESIRKLLQFEFTWLLPGHGRRRYFCSVQEKNEEIETCLAAERVPASN